jgi:hypothetical protein
MSQPNTLEQRRRDLMASDRLLYDYITHIAAAKVLDSAGDMASGFHHGVANRLWGLKRRHREAAWNAARESLREDRRESGDG